MIGSVTTVMVLGLSMVRLLDRSHNGADGIAPRQMVHALQALERSPVAPATLPCDDSGRPNVKLTEDTAPPERSRQVGWI